MSIGHEQVAVTALQPDLWPQPGWSRNGKNLDRRRGLQGECEIHRLIVDQNKVDLRMGHAAGFDRVLDRGFLVQMPNDSLGVTFWPNEKWKVAVEVELKLERFA